MKKNQSIWQCLTQMLYIIFVSHIAWILGLILGLGIFSLIATTMTTFQFINEGQGSVEISRMREFSFWWSNFRDNLKRTWKHSLVYSFLFIILITNLYFLSYQGNPLSMIVYYVTFLLIFLLLCIGIWFAYLAAIYPEEENRTILQNAVAYPLSHLIEMIIVMVLVIALLLIGQEISIGLLVVMGIGSSLLLIFKSFTLLVSGMNLKQSLTQWRRQDSYE